MLNPLVGVIDLKTSFNLPFNIFGIPIKLHVSFLIFFPVLAWIIGSQLGFYIDLLQLDIDAETLIAHASPILIGLIAAGGLFTGVTLHELGHSLVAQTYGIKIESITLHVLGGVAQLEEIPTTPGSEAKMAITGPLVSFGLGGLFWLIFISLGSQSPLPKFVTGYMMYMNFAVGIFNLLPAIPLDGGRILRSLLSLRQSRYRATRTATQISKIIAIAMGIFGLLNFELFLIVIAVFVYFAASSEAQQMILHNALQGLKIKNLMTKDVTIVEPDTTIDNLTQTMLDKRHLGYPVIGNENKVVGIVTLEDLQKSSPQSKTVRDIMTTEVITIDENQGSGEAFNKMTHNNLGRLIVVDESGQMVGIITRTDILNALKITTSLPKATNR